MGSRDLLRAFVAIQLSEQMRAELAAAAEALRTGPLARSVGWTRPERYHLTLRFLGEITAVQANAILEALREPLSQLAAFALCSRRVAWFPTSRRPRVVAAELEESHALRALAEAVEGVVVAVGLAPESRPFRAHVTLGRVRDRLRNAPRLERPLGGSASTVDRIVLMRSELRREGALHSVLGEVGLAGVEMHNEPGLESPRPGQEEVCDG